MKKACCQNCAYAVTMRVAEQVLWVCTNALGMAGRLTPVEPSGGCRQYRQKRTAPVRLAPPASTDPSIRYIPLTKGLFAMVDAADYERVSQHTWTALCVGKNVYGGAEGGFAKAVDLISYECGSPEEVSAYARWLWVRTTNSVRAPLTWTMIATFAGELLKRGTMSGREVRELLLGVRRDVVERKLPLVQRPEAPGVKAQAPG